MTSIQEEARKIVVDNTAADEIAPWDGYFITMELQLRKRTGCSWTEARYAIAEASNPRTLTLGDFANQKLDRDEVIKDLLGLLDDLCGPDATRNEVYQRGIELLKADK